MKRLCMLTAIAVLGTASGTARAASLTCGAVITSSGAYTLTNDLNCSTSSPLGTAIFITGGAAVTINLNGHSIIGPGATTGSEGIRLEGGSVHLANGLIRGFGTAVTGLEADFQGDYIRIVKNGTGISGSLALRTVFHHSYINENTGDGISASIDSAISMSDSQIVGNGGNGITDHEAPMNIQRSVISRNGGYGIFEDEWGVYLKDNRVLNNGRDGIFLGLNDFPDTYSILNNTANGNGGHGIVFAAQPAVDGREYPPSYFEGNSARDNRTSPQCVNIFCSAS
jgi:hypothetical protein